MDLFVRRQSKPVENLAFEGASGRLGPGFGPVYAGHAALVVPAVRIFLPVDNDTRVKKRRSDRP